MFESEGAEPTDDSAAHDGNGRGARRSGARPALSSKGRHGDWSRGGPINFTRGIFNKWINFNKCNNNGDIHSNVFTIPGITCHQGDSTTTPGDNNFRDDVNHTAETILQNYDHPGGGRAH